MSHDHHHHDHRPAPNYPPLRKRMPGPAFYPPAQYPPPLQQLLVRAKEALKDEFLGITTDGRVLPGLFPVTKTGVTLRPAYEAAREFASMLTHEQKHKAMFHVAADEWRTWCNVHPFISRHGIGLYELTPAQREAGLALVSTALSASGFETARNVMRLNEHAAELTGLPEEYGEWYYWLSIFGHPSMDEPWGWQLDGHHLIINCLIYGDQMVLTPLFMGSEPVYAHSGKFKGTEVFREEESQGLAMMRALAPDQRTKAVISTAMPGEVLTAAFRDNERVRFEGIRYGNLKADQQRQLADLIGVYTSKIRPGHAQIRADEIRARLADTHFSWIGGHDDHAAFYYRIHSPVVLIEFDHQPGVVFSNSEPTRDHIHTIVRTPNGNDYGKSLLAQHYARHDHSDAGGGHRRGHG